MRSPLTSTVFIASVLLAACTGVPQPAAHGEPDASDADADGDGDVDTGPEPTMTSIPGWELSWAVRAGGDEHDDLGWSIREAGIAVAPTNDGSVYVVGQIAESAAFGEGESQETVFPDENVGFSDGFIARYNPDGELEWARRIAGNGETNNVGQDCAIDVLVTSDDSAVVAGRFDSSEIILGQGEPNETVFVTNSKQNAFVAKFKSDGDLDWAFQIPKADGSKLSAWIVGAFDSNSLFVAGIFTGTLWPGEELEIASEPSEIWLQENWDGFIAWVDAESGSVARTVRVGNDNEMMNENIVSLPDGSLFAVTRYERDEVFGIGEPNEGTLSCPCPEEPCQKCASIAKYDNEGRLQWVEDLGLSSLSRITLAPLYDGNVGVLLKFLDPWDPDGDGTPFEPVEGEGATAVATLDAENGSVVWARAAYGSMSGGSDHMSSLLAMPGDAFIASFSFRNGLLEFEGEDAAQVGLVTAGEDDIALVRFSSNGTIEWMHRIGSEGEDFAFSGAQLGGTTMWLTGAYGSNPFVATSGNGDDVSLPLSGYTDVFLMRFDSTSVPTD